MRLFLLFIGIIGLASCSGPSSSDVAEQSEDPGAKAVVETMTPVRAGIFEEVMQPTDIEEFARRYADAWSSQNPESVATFFADSGSLTVNDNPPAAGRMAIEEVARGFMAAFPDLRVAFDELSTVGERTLFHWTLTGTNNGPGGTGNPVKISGEESWLFGPDGLVAESLGSFDAEDYARQLGRE